MLRVVVVSLSLLLTGCGLFSGQPASPEFADSTAIQRALGTEGLACHSYQSVPEDAREPGMEGAADVGVCMIDGESPRLVIWKDNDQRQAWADGSLQITCAMADGFGVPALHYVAGNRWSVSDTSKKLADRIAGAIGGEAVHTECSEGQDPQ